MGTSEIFRPSNGDLLIRDSLAHGPILPTDSFRKEERRPQTQGGNRFGQLSHHSFFTRHNPHPSRVKHMKGLLDVPICSVNDDGYFANPRYSLQFPPNSFDSQKLQNWKGRIPVNAIHFNRQLHPINGLQRFTGLNNYPFREKAIPKLGLVPVTETWRDELAAFTRALGLDENNGTKGDGPSQPDDDTRPRTTVYSPETGRIIPPPSRAMSRGYSRRGQLNQQFAGGNLQHISAHPDWENLVLTVLCQILQTDDINALQAWLCSAGEREKGFVLSLVKNALAGAEEYYKQYPAELILETDRAKLPPINERSGSSSGQINRLVLEDYSKQNTEAEVKISQNTSMPTEGTQELPIDASTQTMMDETVEPPANDVTKPTPIKKPLTPLQPARLATGSKHKKTQVPKLSESKPKYTKSSFKNRQDAMWSQDQSINTV